MAIPASITTRASPGACRALSIGSQRLVFVRPCRQTLSERRTKPEPSSNQPQGQQRTVAALLFRVPALGALGLVRPPLAFEKRVGKVVQRHRVTQPEQLRQLLETGASRWPPGGAIKASETRYKGRITGSHGLEVHLQQLPQPAALAQPAPNSPSPTPAAPSAR